MLRITIILIFSFSVFGFSVFAQTYKIYEGDTINFTDERNLKQGIWLSFYSDGNIKSEITYKDGLKKGYAKIYFENGKVAEEGTWNVDKWVGKYKAYYKNGKLNYSWNYNSKGNRSGYQRYYYKNGNLKIEGEWEEGREKGIIKDYYENGSIRSEKKYSNGIIDSTTVKTYKIKEKTVNDNKINKTVNTDNDPKNLKVFKGTGHHVFYNAQKQVEKEGEFIKGILINGKHHFYNKTGDHIKTLIYKEGKVIKQIYYKKSE